MLHPGSSQPVWQTIGKCAGATCAQATVESASVPGRQPYRGAWSDVCGSIARIICEVASMPSLELDIALYAERLRAVYQGQANRVLLRSRDGRKVSLPAHHLRPF